MTLTSGSPAEAAGSRLSPDVVQKNDCQAKSPGRYGTLLRSSAGLSPCILPFGAAARGDESPVNAASFPREEGLSGRPLDVIIVLEFLSLGPPNESGLFAKSFRYMRSTSLSERWETTESGSCGAEVWSMGLLIMGRWVGGGGFEERRRRRT
jgi:hypothetical protein